VYNLFSAKRLRTEQYLALSYKTRYYDYNSNIMSERLQKILA